MTEDVIRDMEECRLAIESLGYYPTHIRMHPNTWEIICEKFFGSDYDSTKGGTMMGLKVWLDSKIEEGKAEIIVMEHDTSCSRIF